MRYVATPISVAFADPVLRAAGLKNDTYGEAKRFFEISDTALHDVLCYCHHGATMTAASAAERVRAIITRRDSSGGPFLNWIVGFFR